MNVTFEEFRVFFSEAIEDEEVILLSLDSNFKEIESWDSFSGMAVISMVDEKFGIRVKAEEMAKVNTFRELYDLILSKI